MNKAIGGAKHEERFSASGPATMRRPVQMISVAAEEAPLAGS
jgi:hypothetical protein